MAEGGQQRVLANLAGALSRRGHRVDWLVFDSPGPYRAQVPANVNVVDLRDERSLGRLVCLLVTHPMSFMLLLWIGLLTPWRFTRPHWTVLEMLRFPALFGYVRRSRPSVIYSAGTPLGTGSICMHHGLGDSPVPERAS